MSMFRDYVEEQLDNRFVYEDEHGFLVYNFQEDMCQLEEIYVKPKFRRKGVATDLYNKAGKIALENECTWLRGTIVIGANNSENSLMCLLKNGFVLEFTQGHIIYLRKNLEV